MPTPLERMDLVTACGRGMLPRLTAKGRLRLRPRHWPNWADVDAMQPWSGSDNPERAGLVVPPEDPAALAEAVQVLAGDPDRRAVMGAAGRRWIVDHLGADAVLGRIERDLRGLMRAARRG